MRRIPALGFGLSVLSTLAQGQTVKMTIEYGGAKAGENVYTREADGRFRSKSQLAIGPVKIDSLVEGRFEGDRLTEYTVDQTGPQSYKLRYADGKITMEAGATKREVPVPPTWKATFGNFHPQLSAPALKLVTRDRKKQVISCFMVDVGQVVDVAFTSSGEKRVGKGTATLTRTEIGPLAIDYAAAPDGTVVGVDVSSQKLRFVAEGWNDLYTDPLAKYPELSQPTFAVKRIAGAKMRTRDGVELVQDVIVPEGEGKFPIILVRTPYGRAAEALNGEFYARRGYAYVVQDVRGRGDSSGAFDPFMTEERDGYDTIDWIAKQPWSNGKVGMIGGSYGGFVQWAAAVSRHPALKCIVPQVSPPDAFRNLPYDHGVFFLWGSVWWGNVVKERTMNVSALSGGFKDPKRFAKLPLQDTDRAVLGYDVPFYDRWLERTSLRDWKGADFTYRLSAVTIPALHISGWWDGDGVGTKLNWAAMRAAGRKNQWLIYGPWTHAFNTTRKLGDVDYGDTAILELDSLYLRWFDTWLKGKAVALEKVPRVQAFVMGANRWAHLPDWPAPSMRAKTLYLAPGAIAEALPKPASAKYTYDPKKDVVDPKLFDLDPSKATTVVDPEERKGSSLVFRSAPVTKSTLITGPIEVELAFRTSARDTDLFAAVVDIDQKGVMRMMGQAGKIRASYLGGFDRPRTVQPGKTYIAKVSPWDTAFELKPGHRLGLLVWSSMFPMYARNLGTGEPIKTGTRMVPQTNTILFGGAKPSRITFRTE